MEGAAPNAGGGKRCSMKFSEMPYQRPDIPALREKLEALRAEQAE